MGVQCKPTSYQMEGICALRWVSFARKGNPVLVRSPEMTQLFEPIPEPEGPSRESRDEIRESRFEKSEG